LTLPTELKELTEADPRDLSQQQLTRLRNILLDDLYLFAYLIFDYQDLVPHLHGRIATLLKRWGEPEFERLMIQVPREAFKTSLCTRANALWQICRDPDLPVAIFNEREPNVAKWVRAIREVVQSNRLFHAVFGDLLPPGVKLGDKRSMPRWWKWSDTELLFQRGAQGIPEASITGLGIGAAAAGGHWPKIIKDDLISEDAVRSPTVMEAAKEWFDKSLYLERPALKGWDLVVCTRWAYGDLYDYVAQKYQYRLYRRSALEEGKSIFPEKWSTQELLIQQTRDPYGFGAQMMNQPRPGKEQSFDPAWLRWGLVKGDKFTISRPHYTENVPHPTEGIPPPRSVRIANMQKAILLDPAPSEQTDRRREPGARNGLVVEGCDAWGRRYILETLGVRIDPLDVINLIFQLCDKWGTNLVGIEEVVFSLVYRHWLRREARLRNRHIRTFILKPGKRDKDTRITAKIPACREGVYYLNQEATQSFYQEYVEYPYGQTRDLLDAWAYDEEVVRRPLSSAEALERSYQQGDRGTRDAVTGY
jgi:hypothetical protein